MRWQGVPWCGKELLPPPLSACLSESGRAAALAMVLALVFPQAGEVYSSFTTTSLVLILDFQTRRAEQLLWYIVWPAWACALWLAGVADHGSTGPG